MGEYFRGWRRKFGAVILLLACIATAEWIRNFYREEAILFCPSSSFVCATFGHGIMLFSCFTFATRDTALSTSGVTLSPLRAINLGWSSEIIEKALEKIEPWGDADAESHFNWGQFTCGVSSHTIPAKTAITFDKFYIAIPFWSLVIPLIAVSAWLLLSKPHQPKALEHSLIRRGEHGTLLPDVATKVRHTDPGDNLPVRCGVGEEYCDERWVQNPEGFANHLLVSIE